MMMWRVTIEAWPYSTGEGAENDQKRAGPRSREFRVKADSFDLAYEAAKQIARGIMSSGHIWQAPIHTIKQDGNQ